MLRGALSVLGRQLLGAAALCCLYAPTAAGGATAAGPGCPTDDAAAAGRRRLGAEPWWCEQWEKDYVEIVITIPMLLVTIAFETAYHRLRHAAGHAYTYGQHSMSSAEKRYRNQVGRFGRPLHESFVDFVAGEFMVLGCLAFTVWSLNQMRFFDWLASVQFAKRTPTTGVDYLHLVEAVHFQLFLGMVCFFSLGFRVVGGSCRRNRELEKLQYRVTALSDELPTWEMQRLQRCARWRIHFFRWAVREVMRWRSDSPSRFAKVVESMGFDPTDDLSEKRLRDGLRACFSFSTYLAFTVRHSCISMIALSAHQLVIVLVGKVLVLVIVHWRHVEQVTTYLGFVLTAVATIGICHVVTENIKLDLDTSVDNDQVMYSSIPLKFLAWLGKRRVFRSLIDVPKLLLDTYQLLVFFSCFHFAGMLISTEFYNSLADLEAIAIIQVVFYLGFFCVLLVVMPRAIPDFSCVTALPPFFNFRNQELFLQVLHMYTHTAWLDMGEVGSQPSERPLHRIPTDRSWKVTALHVIHDLTRNVAERKAEVPFHMQLSESLSRHGAACRNSVEYQVAEEHVIDDLMATLQGMKSAQKQQPSAAGSSMSPMGSRPSDASWLRHRSGASRLGPRSVVDRGARGTEPTLKSMEGRRQPRKASVARPKRTKSTPSGVGAPAKPPSPRISDAPSCQSMGSRSGASAEVGRAAGHGEGFSPWISLTSSSPLASAARGISSQ